MAQTVIGIFNNEADAQKAVQQLENDGFNRNNIDISYNSYNNREDVNAYDESKENDSFGDKVNRFFSNLFGDDDDNTRKNYAEAARRGSVVTVHAQTQDEAERAVDILDLYGAVDVDETAKGYGTTYGTNTDTNRENLASDDNLEYRERSTLTDDEDLNYRKSTYGVTEDQTADIGRTSDVNRPLDVDRTSDVENSIPVIEENLDLNKKEVETGGVRVRSRIIERPVEESLRLRSERVTVDRNAVNRPASEAELNNFKEESFELTEHAEIPVVRKEARVVEEVRVGKQVENREETIRDTVRKTDVDIENFKSGDSKNWNEKEPRR